MPHESDSERPCEVRMEDGTWQPGVIVREERRGPRAPLPPYVHAALVRHRGVTAWLYRGRGRGHVNEWREVE